MRRSSIITIIVCAVAVVTSSAEAKLDLYVDKSTQRISVVQSGSLLYVWPVSTGRDRSSTPNGIYVPERLERSWFSKAYYNAPMPHAIFFHNGYAIHGSYDIAQLGGPASHGCVRLHPQDAALLFAMVEQEGPGNTTIVIGGDNPTNPWAPRYRDFEDPFRSSYFRDGGTGRGEYVPSMKTPPYYYADRDVERARRRSSDNGQFATTGAHPINRTLPPRRDAQGPAEPMLALRGSFRPPAPVKSSSACPTCSSIREPHEAINRHPNSIETVKNPSESAKSSPSVLPSPASLASAPPSSASQSSASPPPASPAPEQPQASLGYKVLPKAYWAGPSWRWRMKSDPDIR